MQSEDRIEGSVMGIGPGPEGSSPTVDSRRSEDGGAEELFGQPFKDMRAHSRRVQCPSEIGEERFCRFVGVNIAKYKYIT